MLLSGRCKALISWPPCMVAPSGWFAAWLSGTEHIYKIYTPRPSRSWTMPYKPLVQAAGSERDDDE